MFDTLCLNTQHTLSVHKGLALCVKCLKDIEHLSGVAPVTLELQQSVPKPRAHSMWGLVNPANPHPSKEPSFGTVEHELQVPILYLTH